MRAIALLFALTTFTAAPESSPWERLKTLRGEWEAKTERGATIRVRYHLISNDSVLVQSFTTASGRETMTLLHPDGARVLATHYCGQGNQPRLALESSSTNDHFTFNFLDATNLEKPSSAHLVRLELVLEDAQHYTEIETYEEDKKPDVTALHFRRSGNFEVFSGEYRSASTPAAKKALADAFFANLTTPILAADGSALFLYRGSGKEKSVRVIGEFRRTSPYVLDWDPRGEALERLTEDGDVYFAKVLLEPDARVEYQLLVDNEKKLDPLNARKAFNGVASAEVSELVMPAHPHFEDPPRVAVRGAIETVHETWAKTKIDVYLPPGYDASKRYPVLYTADGGAWQTYLALPATLDAMIASGAIEPLIAVMIDPTEDRRSFYLFNAEYLSYLAEVVHFIDARYSTRADAGSRVHAGTSAGGRAALFTAMERPAMFRGVAMLSPSLGGSLAYFEPYFTKKKRAPNAMRVFLSSGSYEGSLFDDAATVERWLRASGAAVSSVHTHEGHSFAAWKHQTPAMLTFFFGKKSK